GHRGRDRVGRPSADGRHPPGAPGPRRGREAPHSVRPGSLTCTCVSTSPGTSTWCGASSTTRAPSSPAPRGSIARTTPPTTPTSRGCSPDATSTRSPRTTRSYSCARPSVSALIAPPSSVVSTVRSVEQRGRGGGALGRDREVLELVDARELDAHRDVRHALEDDLDHDRHAELGGHALRLGERVAELLGVGHADRLAAQ